MQNVFTYGSLMFAPVWSRVVNGAYAQTPARLEGYQRLAVLGEDYPVAIPAPDHRVEGILYIGVGVADMEQLDEFEGEYYQRLSVTVIDTAGISVTAWVYILNEQYRHILDTEEWDAGRFATTGIQHFLARYPGFIT